MASFTLCTKIIKIKLTKIHCDINIVYQLICLFIKKQNKKKTKNNSGFLPSTNMKQLLKAFYRRTVSEILEIYSKISLL